MTDPAEINPNLGLLRSAEGELILSYLTPGARVLEIGGGSGLHAKLIHDHGCEVVSIDVAGRARPPVQHFPVQDYDGIHLPAADASFDVIYSSSVLEHIRDLPAMLREMRRVLKPSGFALHIVPSPVWRFWTIATRYPYFARQILRRGPAEERAPDGRSLARRIGSLVKTALIEPPHGERSSSFAELYYYRLSVWRRAFEEGGLEVQDVRGNGLFYTGYTTFPRLSLESRRALAGVLGSSCYVFLLKPARGAEDR